MSAWYEIQEGKEVAHVRASNTRTAIDKGFRSLCGMDFTLPPGVPMTIRCIRLSGKSELVRTLESNYLATRPKDRREREAEIIAEQQLKGEADA